MAFHDFIEHFIDREIQRARVDDAHFAVAHELVEPPSAWTGLRVLAGALLEHRDDARFAMTRAVDDELSGQHTLAGARRAGEQHRVAGRNATAEHLVQFLDADRETCRGLGLPFPTVTAGRDFPSGPTMTRGNT